MKKRTVPDHSQEMLLSRRALARRWGCCVETIKRAQYAGKLKAVRFNARLLRYRLSEVEALETAASGETDQ